MQQNQQRTNQRDRLLALLKGRAPDWVPISEVFEIAGFQYGARILELRRLGHRIANDPGRAFRLITAIVSREPSRPAQETKTARLFPDDAPLRHLDLG